MNKTDSYLLNLLVKNKTNPKNFQQFEKLENSDSTTKLNSVKKNSLLTNKRRRDFQIKAHLHEFHEELRRQEILQKRHDKQQEITERYQRTKRSQSANRKRIKTSQEHLDRVRRVYSPHPPKDHQKNNTFLSYTANSSPQKSKTLSLSENQNSYIKNLSNYTKINTEKTIANEEETAFLEKYGLISEKNPTKANFTPHLHSKIFESSYKLPQSNTLPIKRDVIENLSQEKNVENSEPKSLFEMKLEKEQEILKQQQNRLMEDFSSNLFKIKNTTSENTVANDDSSDSLIEDANANNNKQESCNPRIKNDSQSKINNETITKSYFIDGKNVSESNQTAFFPEKSLSPLPDGSLDSNLFATIVPEKKEKTNENVNIELRDEKNFVENKPEIDIRSEKTHQPLQGILKQTSGSTDSLNMIGLSSASQLKDSLELTRSNYSVFNANAGDLMSTRSISNQSTVSINSSSNKKNVRFAQNLEIDLESVYYKHQKELQEAQQTQQEQIKMKQQNFVIEKHSQSSQSISALSSHESAQTQTADNLISDHITPKKCVSTNNDEIIVIEEDTATQHVKNVVKEKTIHSDSSSRKPPSYPNTSSQINTIKKISNPISATHTSVPNSENLSLETAPVNAQSGNIETNYTKKLQNSPQASQTTSANGSACLKINTDKLNHMLNKAGYYRHGHQHSLSSGHRKTASATSTGRSEENKLNWAEKRSNNDDIDEKPQNSHQIAQNIVAQKLIQQCSENQNEKMETLTKANLDRINQQHVTQIETSSAPQTGAQDYSILQTKTPTEAEIEQLWADVRNCVDRQKSARSGSMGSTGSQQRVIKNVLINNTLAAAIKNPESIKSFSSKASSSSTLKAIQIPDNNIIKAQISTVTNAADGNSSNEGRQNGFRRGSLRINRSQSVQNLINGASNTSGTSSDKPHLDENHDTGSTISINTLSSCNSSNNGRRIPLNMSNQIYDLSGIPANYQANRSFKKNNYPANSLVRRPPSPGQLMYSNLPTPYHHHAALSHNQISSGPGSTSSNCLSARSGTLRSQNSAASQHHHPQPAYPGAMLKPTSQIILANNKMVPNANFNSSALVNGEQSINGINVVDKSLMDFEALENQVKNDGEKLSINSTVNGTNSGYRLMQRQQQDRPTVSSTLSQVNNNQQAKNNNTRSLASKKQPNSAHQPKPATILSMEEAKILKSLDRLDICLKTINENQSVNAPSAKISD